MSRDIEMAMNEIHDLDIHPYVLQEAMLRILSEFVYAEWEEILIKENKLG